MSIIGDTASSWATKARQSIQAEDARVAATNTANRNFLQQFDLIRDRIEVYAAALNQELQSITLGTPGGSDYGVFSVTTGLSGDNRIYVFLRCSNPKIELELEVKANTYTDNYPYRPSNSASPKALPVRKPPVCIA